VALLPLLGSPRPAQAGTVVYEQKLSDTEGGFLGYLNNSGHFGYSVSSIGDLDGDGVPDVAVGVESDDWGGTTQGSVWILFLHATGVVKLEQRIRDTAVYTGKFGGDVESIGDLDGDGVPDLAVGAWADSDGGTARGALWVLFLDPDGSVKGHQKISDTAGGFTGVLDDLDRFGRSVAHLGDLDGDGVGDLAVGAYLDDDGDALDQGAVWILFLNTDGTVKSHQKISEAEGGFGGALDGGDQFGLALAALGDADGDGVPDLVVGAPNDDDGGSNRGAVWTLWLNSDGTVKGHPKISSTEGGLGAVLEKNGLFGHGVALAGDLDGNGVREITVGAYADDGSRTPADPDRGAVWILFRNADGTVRGEQKINTNPTGYLSEGFMMGQTWTASLDNTGTGNLLATIMGYADPLEAYIPGADDYLLIDPLSAGGELLQLSLGQGAGVIPFSAQVPSDLSLTGFRLSTQGGGFGGSGGTTLHNAYDHVVGY